MKLFVVLLFVLVAVEAKTRSRRLNEPQGKTNNQHRRSLDPQSAESASTPTVVAAEWDVKTTNYQEIQFTNGKVTGYVADFSAVKPGFCGTAKCKDSVEAYVETTRTSLKDRLSVTIQSHDGIFGAGWVGPLLTLTCPNSMQFGSMTLVGTSTCEEHASTATVSSYCTLNLMKTQNPSNPKEVVLQVTISAGASNINMLKVIAQFKCTP